MSYEICVLEPGYAADRDAANKVWNDQAYWDTSLPDADRTARKWRVKDLLMAFDSSLKWLEPKPPSTGFFAKWFSKPPPVQHYLHLYREGDYGETSFELFDQAIEINLPWDTPRTEVAAQVRAVWRYLEHLSASGWTIYDTERDVLMDLRTDMDAVIARYLEILGPDDEDAGAEPAAGTAPSKSVSAGSRNGNKPFTGNVE